MDTKKEVSFLAAAVGWISTSSSNRHIRVLYCYLGKRKKKKREKKRAKTTRTIIWPQNLPVEKVALDDVLLLLIIPSLLLESKKIFLDEAAWCSWSLLFLGYSLRVRWPFWQIPFWSLRIKKKEKRAVNEKECQERRQREARDDTSEDDEEEEGSWGHKKRHRMKERKMSKRKEEITQAFSTQDTCVISSPSSSQEFFWCPQCLSSLFVSISLLWFRIWLHRPLWIKLQPLLLSAWCSMTAEKDVFQSKTQGIGLYITKETPSPVTSLLSRGILKLYLLFPQFPGFFVSLVPDFLWVIGFSFVSFSQDSFWQQTTQESPSSLSSSLCDHHDHEDNGNYDDDGLGNF